MGNDIKIVVLDRGWVFLGRVRKMEDSIVITQARNIRRWGTSEGLGQLRRGPLPGTMHDASGTVTVPMQAVIFTLDVEDGAWTREIAS